MSLKKICISLLVIAFIAAVIWFCYTYMNTSKQVYEGVLVYKDKLLAPSCLL